MAADRYIDSDIQSRFEFFDYGHALEILHGSFPREWEEIQEALRRLPDSGRRHKEGMRGRV